MVKWLTALICISASFLSYAQTTVAALSQHPQWQRLLHLDKGQAAVLSDDFYLSGTTDPAKELQVTLSSLSQPVGEDPDLHAQCRYPARTFWLKTQVPDLVLPEVECPHLNAWRAKNSTESFSLVFVSGYLGNPASFFGHLLIKLNNGDGSADLLDNSINYGANADRDDNPVKYVTYGLFGGYDASFSDQDYYQLEYGYAENEQRELWEYRLSLTADEVALIEAHLWELSGVKFRYLFLSANCSSQMARLFEIVLDTPLLKPYQPWDMPLDVFKSLEQAKHHGKPLVAEVKKRDSKFSRINQKYMAMEPAEQQMTKAVIRTQEEINSSGFNALSEESQKRVVDLLFDYYQLQIDFDGNEQAKTAKQKLLVKSLSLPAGRVIWPESQAEPPHKAQDPNRISVGAGYAEGEYLSLGYRAGYYDFLSRAAARYRNSNAVFVSAELKADRQGIWLSRFDLFDVTTLNILQADLFEDRRWAWRSRLTVEQKDLSTRDQERLRFYVAMGWAGEADFAWYALPGLMADFNYPDESRLTMDFGLLVNTPVWKTYFNLTPWVDANGEYSVKAEWDNRLGDSQSWDVRLKLLYDRVLDTRLEYAFYF